MFDSPLIMASRDSAEITLDVNASDVDIAALLGNPTEPIDVLVIIDPDVELTGFTAFDLPDDSYLYIVCAGYLLGTGGNGGNGYIPGTDLIPGEPPLPSIPAGVGGDGGSGIIMGCPTTVDLTNGYCYGGGGGGGGGGELIYGGGGGGVHDGLGGPGGGPGGSPGTDSTTGPLAIPGVGSDNGGNGGDKAEAGGPGIGPESAVGGAAGLAIEKNGFELNFRGTDEATLVTESRLIGERV